MKDWIRALTCLLVCALTGVAVAQAPAAAPVGKYVGPGSCAASACHGGIRPSPNSRVLQNEYSTWILQDRHSQAYRALQTPVARRMAKILGIDSAESAQKCLTCHALAVPPEKKGRDFEISEGVTCENCHGPASGWLGPHTLKNWRHEQSVANGMFDTKNLTRRSSQCLSCHLGTAEKQVDHEMIAAGHPDLVFELDSYSAVMPAHWKKSDDPSIGIRTWAVGQAVKLREALERLARRAKSPVWPEFSEMECFSCHHDLSKADKSWRQERGYAMRPPGNPPWNAAHYSVLRAALKGVDPQLSSNLERDLNDVFQLASRINSDREQLAQRASQAAATANTIADRLNTMPIDRELAGRMMNAILAESDSLSSQGTRTAEQTAMSLESLFAAQGRGAHADVRNVIDDLFKELANPSAYNGPRFAAQLKRLNGMTMVVSGGK